MGWIVFGGGVVLGLAMGVLVMVWALCKVATVVPPKPQLETDAHEIITWPASVPDRERKNGMGRWN